MSILSLLFFSFSSAFSCDVVYDSVGAFSFSFSPSLSQFRFLSYLISLVVRLSKSQSGRRISFSSWNRLQCDLRLLFGEGFCCVSMFSVPVSVFHYFSVVIYLLRVICITPLLSLFSGADFSVSNSSQADHVSMGAQLFVSSGADLDFQYGRPSPVVPLRPERLSLPSTAGVVSLLDVLQLPPHDRELVLERSITYLPWPAEKVSSMLKSPLSLAPYVATLERLVSCSLVSFSLTPPLRCNSLFAVAKDENADRLILDARSANAVFAVPPKVSLPSPDLIASFYT